MLFFCRERFERISSRVVYNATRPSSRYALRRRRFFLLFDARCDRAVDAGRGGFVLRARRSSLLSSSRRRRGGIDSGAKRRTRIRAGLEPAADAGRDAERDGVDASRRSVLVLVAVRRCRSGVVGVVLVLGVLVLVAVRRHRSGIVAVLGVLVLVAVRRRRSGIVAVLGVLVLVPVAAVAVLFGLGGGGLRG